MKTWFTILILILLVACTKEPAVQPIEPTPEVETPAVQEPVQQPAEPEVIGPEVVVPEVLEPDTGPAPSSQGLVEFYINTDQGLKRQMLYLYQKETYMINGNNYLLKASFIGRSGNENKVIFSVNGEEKSPLAEKGELMIDGYRVYVKKVYVK